MEIYLVGGAVRDELLGLKPKERDWVVVGATPEEMLAKGFIQVGKDFPVYLHPETREEYALARTERKSGRGYKGFTVYAAPEVTLKEDLARRDLTINAIAKDSDGNLIDPFYGQVDLKNRTLRHVSDAFIEDPLRVLRAARFAARFSDFSIAPETMGLMKKIVEEGEMAHLVPDRVWVEIDKTLAHDNATIFFQVLQECDAFDKLFPLLSGEPDFFRQGMTNLKKADHLEKTLKLTLFLFPFIEKANQQHLIGEFCENFRIPNEYKTLLLILARVFPLYIELQRVITAENMLLLLEKADAFRRPIQLELFLKTTSILIEDGTELNSLIEKSVNAAKNIDIAALKKSGVSGIEMAHAIKQKRLAAIDETIRTSIC